MVSLPTNAQTGHVAPAARSRAQRYWKVLRAHPVNWLLVFVPLGLAAGYVQDHHPDYLKNGGLYVFVFNFLAIVPLAAVLSDLTEILASKTSVTIGGLLNATFGNVVELLVGLAALLRGEVRIVQTSMLGSILSNLILVLGSAFIAGGYNRLQLKFSQTAAQTMSSMMALSCISLLIPAAFSITVHKHSQPLVVLISRYSSIVLLIIYGLYLLFELRTHRVFFEGAEEEDEEDAPDVDLSQTESLVGLALVTLIIAFSADYLVGSIEAVVEHTRMSKSFIGLILLPIVGNAAEHVTAILMAMKNKLDLTVNVAVGSSMQIALFMLPFLVIWGWIIDVPMSLHFEGFDALLLFVAVYLTGIILQDGETNWLEGSLLVALYSLIAITYSLFPDGSVKALIERAIAAVE